MIIRNIDYNRQLDNKTGVYYENGDLHIDENRVIVDEEYKSYHFPHDCICNASDCGICSNNQDYEMEIIRISPLTSRQIFEFQRIRYLLRGHLWTNWYEPSHAITPINK